METVTKHENAGQAWKLDVARRVAAHRGRAGMNAAADKIEALPAVAETEERRWAAQIAATVAARYAAAPTYREMMNAPEGTAVAVEEPVAMEVAATADSVVESPEIDAAAFDVELGRVKKPCASATADAVMMAVGPEAVTEEVTRPFEKDGGSTRLRIQMLPEPPETFAPEVLPVRVIESPRELIAVRRVRPRLAEGAAAQVTSGQLRIFEVEADQISTLPEPPGLNGVVSEPLVAALQESWEPTTDIASPTMISSDVLEWEDEVHSSYVQTEPAEYMQDRRSASIYPGMRTCERAATIVVQTAPLEMRFMSTVVDGCVVTAMALAGLLLYLPSGEAVAGLAPNLLAPNLLAPNALGSMKMMLLYGGAGYVTLWLVYQLLCIALIGATPGMLYAGLNLITFEDERPSRLAMCGRVLAQLLSLCPLGLGYLWAWMDMDGLGWHDRVTHIYQRSKS